MTQAEQIKEQIALLVSNGMSKKQIYDRIHQEMQIPRPTIRRVAKEYRDEITSISLPQQTPLQEKIRRTLYS